MSQTTDPHLTSGDNAFATAERLGIELGRLRPEHVTEWRLHDPEALLELSEGVWFPASITVWTRGGARLRLPDDAARLSKLPMWRLDGVQPHTTFAFEPHTRKRLLQEGVPQPLLAELEIAVSRYRAQLTTPEGQRPRVQSERRQVRALWDALLRARDALRGAEPAIVWDFDRTSHLWWKPLSAAVSQCADPPVPGALPEVSLGSPAWPGFEGLADTLDLVALAVSARVAALSGPQDRGRKKDEDRDDFLLAVANVLEKAGLKSQMPSLYDPQGGAFERCFRLAVEAGTGLRLARGENLRDVLRRVRHHQYWFRWAQASPQEKRRLEEARTKDNPPVSVEEILRIEHRLQQTAPHKRRLPKDPMLREVLRLRQRLGISGPPLDPKPSGRKRHRRPARSRTKSRRRKTTPSSRRTLAR